MWSTVSPLKFASPLMGRHRGVLILVGIRRKDPVGTTVGHPYLTSLYSRRYRVLLLPAHRAEGTANCDVVMVVEVVFRPGLDRPVL